ncbi:hypothetical protein [Cupriavidus basilensis]|uniref:hypothetical protein n=1 Tax=Cupriavidus basilensis TaxID=68895 RepID=UPI0002DAE35B|nr:hypothetical protein [Cupriavidus basilensis]
MKRWIQLACAALLPAVLAACEAQPAQPARHGDAAIAQGKPMKASKTYLYLLRKTPFFTSLNTSQLRWTIDHSREWEVERGTVITQCAGASAADAWVLLDGGWQLEHEGRAYPAGHADPGKWFSARQASGTCRLVATGHGYVMQIARAEFDAMLAQGFAFDKHLDAGCRYYAEIFGNAPAGAQGPLAAP